MSGRVILDGNEAAAHVAYSLSEVMAIYPITPSSTMGELVDEWSSQGRKNLWGTVPSVTEMQSEAGAVGVIHGALQAGALSTTFTASQGLLLMIPNMFKIAGELTPTVFHVSARSVATHALSIFGDHSDVMACRATGWAMLCASSVQECMDMALVAHASTLEARLPFVHFFDGFRTSHELTKIDMLRPEDLRSMVDDALVLAHRSRGLNPEHPQIRGTAQNPDVFFQAREACNPYYSRVASIVQSKMDRLAALTGRQYRLFDYVGHPQADRVVVVMGSGAEVTHETVLALQERGERVGVLKVRLFRPFSAEALLRAIPPSAKSIAVLDRTKEPGALGEPLYQDVLTAYAQKISMEGGGHFPRIIGGRYGLSSKEFTPAMAKAVFDELKRESPQPRFTVGIQDDVTHLSLDYDSSFSTEHADTFRGIFIGLGSDGTVSANKNSIKLIGEGTGSYAQGYFVYDSKKSGSITKSHLRFGPQAIRSSYLISRASFIACHQFNFVERIPLLEEAEEGAVFLLNAPYGPQDVWSHLPTSLQREIIQKKVRFYVIDAYRVAQDAGMGGRINTIMQTCFFAISGVLPREKAITKIKDSIRKSFGKRGEELVQRNFQAVDQTLAQLFSVEVPSEVTSTFELRASVPLDAPAFVQRVTAPIIAGRGDTLPVSALPPDGAFPTGTAKWEKRNISQVIPEWVPDLCIQCGKCVFVCPHSVIRTKIYDAGLLEAAPTGFKHMPTKGKEWPSAARFTIQVAPEDCTGCQLCVEVCPAKSKSNSALKALNMVEQRPVREREAANWRFFDTLPQYDRTLVKIGNVKESQLLQPLFEFSGACSGCGETPYIRLVTQLFGDRLLVANATGCSSIYGGNLPTTPYTTNAEGRGPAWANSLFEDNAEFGLGMRLAVKKKDEQAREMLTACSAEFDGVLVEQILSAAQTTEVEIHAQRERIQKLKQVLATRTGARVAELLSLVDYLVRKSVWIFGGDGWGYDIGFGGLDHVLASGEDVNILLLDTEVYSNTGGQMSKATPMGAIAKFASGGKSLGKKDLGLLAMDYGHCYVAQIAFGANDVQTLRALIEAEHFRGPSLVIAYSHCIAHGYNLTQGLDQQKLAVSSGHWPLYRYNPNLAAEGIIPLQLDSRDPKTPLKDFMHNETRFMMLTKSNPKRAMELEQKAQLHVRERWEHLKMLATTVPGPQVSKGE